MAIMSIDGEPPSEDRPWTAADLARGDLDEGYRYEIVDGRLEVSPSPAQPHTRLQARLVYHLTDLAPDDIEIQSEAGVTLNSAGTHHRIPDLVAFSTEHVEYPYITRPPLLVIEVLSLSTALHDLNIKRREYAKFGIPSYWIVNPDPGSPGILELRLDGDDYQTVTEVDGEELFETDVPFPVRFVPHWLVADGPWRRHISGD